MKLGMFETYIVLINIIGFILYCINILLCKHIKHKQSNSLLMIISFLGGSLGIIIAILLFDRECVKDNMMSRIFVICIFIIQLILLYMLKIYDSSKITFNIWKFLNKYQIILVYLGIVNFITFIVFALDKIKAISGKWRYKILTLLGISFIGGSVGGLLSMYIFKHKTNVDYFTWGIPIIMIMQVIVIIFLTNVM